MSPNVGGEYGCLVPRRLSAFDLDEEVRTESYVAVRLLHELSGTTTGGFFFLLFAGILEWAMLGSNQRPLPCEVRATYAAAYPMVSVMRFLPLPYPV